MAPSQMNDNNEDVDQLEDLKSRAKDPEESAQSNDDPEKVDEIEAKKKRKA